MNRRLPKTAQTTMTKVLIFALISLLVMIGIVANISKSSDYITSINTCRTSVILQKEASLDIKGVTVFKPTPKICKTHDIQIPETKGIFVYEKTRDDVMKNIADRMADCWYQFGEGNVDDVFGADMFDDKCFSCFTFTVDDIKVLKDQSITKADLFTFMQNTPYKASTANLPYCSNEVNEDCVDATAPECERKGGRCSEESAKVDETVYSNWQCDNDDVCFIKTQNMMTYMQYIYLSEGKGAVLFDSALEEFEFDKEYSITYIADTSVKDLNFIAIYAGGVGVTGAVVAGLGVLLAPVTAGASLTLTLAVATAGGVAGAAAGAYTGVKVADVIDSFSNNDIDTIYISDSMRVGEVCNEQMGNG